MTTSWQLRSEERRREISDRRARVLLARAMIAVGVFEALWFGVVVRGGASEHAMVGLGCVLIVVWLVRAPLAALAPAVCRTLAGAGAAMVVAVGCLRVVRGVHYPSDVLAGWALAVLVVAALGLLELALGRGAA